MSGSNALRFEGVSNVLDREYRNAPAYQWARELSRNGVEAGATNIEFGIEWQSAAKGVYRLQYADDGCGMSHDDLRDYMRTLGKSSKVVGGPHDNYAIGCRMTLLPWNPEGVVVISVHDGETNMVKLRYEAEADGGNGEYVLEEVEWDDANAELHRATVYPPYVDPELDIDWAEAVPTFVKEAGHGTTFVLLGRSVSDDTFEGDTERGESARELTRKYFNVRFWNLPDHVRLRCVEFTKPGDRATWPKTAGDTDLYQNRAIKGAEDLVNYVKRGGESVVQHHGVVPLNDGSKVHWYLREPGVDTGGIGSSSGFIALLYRGELYGHAYASKDDGDLRVGSGVYRQFSIGSADVRTRVFLIIEPPEYDETTDRPGVAPSTGRADLYWMGGGLSARSIKASDWADEFAEEMPDPITEALRAAHEDNKTTSEERRERLKRVMDRLSNRWRAPRARSVDQDGDTTTRPTGAGTVPRQRPDVPSPKKRRPKRKRVVVNRGRAGTVTIGQTGTGTAQARTTSVTLGYPEHEWVKEDDIADEGMIAAWQGPSTAHPHGLIQLDETHPVVRGQVEYWQRQYPPGVATQVEEIVKDAYADVAIAKVAHIHALTGTVISEERRNEMLLNPALTASLVGLLGEDALITPRLGGLGAKKKRPDGESPSPADSIVPSV